MVSTGVEPLCCPHASAFDVVEQGVAGLCKKPNTRANALPLLSDCQWRVIASLCGGRVTRRCTLYSVGRPSENAQGWIVHRG